MTHASDETHFGFRQVPLGDKQALVDDVFHSVARRYDLMNDLMSLGLHRAWKDALVTAVDPPKGEQAFKLLDVAGGTGDIALRVVETGGFGTTATVCDINQEMLAVGRERAYERGRDDTVTFVEGNAEALPFPDKSFDAVTIAFGIRNVQESAVALAEVARVLKPGGRLAILEFSTPPQPLVRAAYLWYFRNILPRLGRLVSRHGEAYSYLPASVEGFTPPAEFVAQLERAGLGRCEAVPLTFGVVYLYVAERPVR